MLTAGLLAVVLVSTAGAAGPSRAPIYAVEGASLLQLDSETLAVSGRARYAGNRCGAIRSARASSPDGRRLAVADDCQDFVTIFNTRSFDWQREIPLMHYHPRAFAWPAPRTLLVAQIEYGDVNNPAFIRVDPDAGTATRQGISGAQRTWQSEARALGGNVMAIATPGPSFGCCEEWFGAPLWIHALGRSGDVVSRATKIRFGIENWHVTARAPLPPVARRAVAGARQDLARRKGIAVGETLVRRVTPWTVFRIQYGYYVEVHAGNEGVQYRCTYPCEDVGAPSEARSSPPENDLLRAKNGTWEVVDAALVDARARDRALIVTSGRVYADVDLTRVGSGGTRIRYHRLRNDLGQFVDGPAQIPGRKVFVPVRSKRSSGVPDQLVLLDLRTNRVRRLTSSGGLIEPAGSGVLLYGGGTETDGSAGVKFFDARGHRRYTTLKDQPIARVQVRKPFAYVTIWRGEIGDWDHTATAVVRLDSGRVLRTVTFPQPVELLVGRALRGR